jgi:3-hydroxyisobutyrate dehydrogenase-like beta-hydroxyacid dehydrogenase
LISEWNFPDSQRVTAFDIKQYSKDTAREIARCAEQLGIALAHTPADAVAEAELVFSTVTADQAMLAAQSVAGKLQHGSYYCDLNSCAPSSKRRSAAQIEHGGARCVDIAVMAPVHPNLNMVPVLVSGPHAASVAPVLEA